MEFQTGGNETEKKWDKGLQQIEKQNISVPRSFPLRP